MSTLKEEALITTRLIRAGDGLNFPPKGCTCRVHYTATLEDGTKVDSSRDRGVPYDFKFGVGQVILGWDSVLGLMSQGQIVEIQRWHYDESAANPSPGYANKELAAVDEAVIKAHQTLFGGADVPQEC